MPVYALVKSSVGPITNYYIMPNDQVPVGLKIVSTHGSLTVARKRRDSLEAARNTRLFSRP